MYNRRCHDTSEKQRCGTAGFTLIELSIVLVIIGLIVGGVLVGRDLITAATVRAQVSQIEKYNSAVNTFRGKYGTLPGDVTFAIANQAGLATVLGAGQLTRGGGGGLGDGNGLLEGIYSTPPGALVNGAQQVGETTWAWVDLSASNLIDGGFTYVINNYPFAAFTATSVGNIMPAAKIGNGNFVYIYSYLSQNYWGLSAITAINWGSSPISNTNITVRQAYNIDQKIDDGLPQSGNVMAWALLSASGHPDWAGVAPGAAGTASSTSCYDNGGSASNPMQYSLMQNNGAGANCAVSFKFQ